MQKIMGAICISEEVCHLKKKTKSCIECLSDRLALLNMVAVRVIVLEPIARYIFKMYGMVSTEGDWQWMPRKSFNTKVQYTFLNLFGERLYSQINL